jgi:glycosyltransferase involved in cell wall biosynthesis
MLLRHSDRIVAPSADLRRKLVELFPEHAGRAVFIHNGIEVERFSRATAKENENRSRYILSVSAYKKQKNLDVLIRAMRIVADHDAKLKLVLVGEGTSLRQELELLAASLNLTNQIEFHGKKTPAEIVDLLHGCEVFVLPSRFETFGIAVVEAMACRRPVVVTNAGGMPEIVRHGRSGFVVESNDARALADALITLCSDASLRRQFGQAAFEDAQQNFHMSAMGKRYEETFALADTPATINAMTAGAGESVLPGVRLS